VIAAAALVLRLVAGTIFIAQGWRKIVDAADAPHGRANLERMIAGRGLPRPALLALLVGATELIGGGLLLTGLLVRLAAIPLAVILLVAIFGFKWKQGFHGGWDWPFSVLGIVVAIAILGAGAVSLDALVGLD
jgi:putative oxidoreductase